VDPVVGMAVFARVVESKSFSAAAQQLGLSKAAVSKQVARLERTLGAQLLNRTTRRLSLTEVGRAYYEHCARVVDEAQAAEVAVSELRSKPRGLLKVTTSVAFGTLHIAPAITQLLGRYTELSVQLEMDDRVMDLAKEGYDVAVRMSANPPPNVVARRLVPVHWAVCAAPAYLERYGVPRAPDELGKHNCLFYWHLDHDTRWRFRSSAGDVEARVSGTFSAHSSLALRQAMLQGLGIARLPTFAVGCDIHDGKAVVLLPEYQTLDGSSFYAVYLPTRHVSPKVRAFIDFFVERFSPEPEWDRLIRRT
jgi:DNA-binding transcriptional LysR family regulator